MIRQIAAITLTALRSIPARWAAALVVVIGMAGVVGVMVSGLAMVHGFQDTFGRAARADRVIVLRSGEDNGMDSAITREQLPIVMNVPGFARDSDGKPLASAQKFMSSVLRERKSGAETNVLLRGVGEKAWKVWPEVKIVEGRAFTPGRRELIAGRAAQRQFEDLELGREVEMANGPWTVVGIFEADGSVYESQLWGDAELVFAGYSLTGQFSSVIGLLESEASFQTLSNAITTNPKLAHAVKREAAYYAEQTGNLDELMQGLGYVVASIMALGALFSAVNTMYAAVKARALEIATLRAIGFGSAPVVLSVLIEAVVLCVVGALLGAGFAYLMFNGYTLSTASSGVQVGFAFQVTAGMLVQGMVWGCVIGLIGGLFPAIRAARRPVAEALRGE